MINNDDELELNRAALRDLEAALIALKRKIEGRNPSLFNSMAESYYKDITSIRSEIDKYLGGCHPNTRWHGRTVVRGAAQTVIRLACANQSSICVDNQMPVPICPICVKRLSMSLIWSSSSLRFSSRTRRVASSPTPAARAIASL